MGTPSYMSPEQVRGDQVDHRSDIFSVGAVFYEFLTFCKPFRASSVPETFFKILEQDPERPSSIVPGIPEEVCDIVLRALVKEPDRRYQQVDELLRELEAFRPVLEERKYKLLREVRDAVQRLSEFVEGTTELREELDRRQGTDMTTSGQLDWSFNGEDEQARGVRYADLGYVELLEVRRQAEREQRWIVEQLDRLKRAASLVDDAVSLEKQGQLGKALQVADEILREMPDQSQAGPLAERIRTALDAQRVTEECQTRIAALLEEAHAQSGNEEAALRALTALLALEPHHHVALELKKTIETRREAREREEHERQRRVMVNLEAARTAERASDLEGARQAAQSVDDDEPGHPEAQQLLERVETKLAARKQREQIERQARDLLQRVKRLAAREDYRAAIAVLEQAEPAVSGEASIQNLLKDYRHAVRVQEEALERARRIAEHFQQGKAAFERGEHQASAAPAPSGRILRT